LKLLASLALSVVASAGFGGAVYELARWGQVHAWWGGPIPVDFETRVVGEYYAEEHEGSRRCLQLGADGRYTLIRRRSVKDEMRPVEGSAAENGSWEVDGRELRLRSDAVERRVTTSMTTEDIDLVVEGDGFRSPRQVCCDI